MNINIGPNTVRVYEYLKNKNLQPNVIKNIMGNLVKESNMEFNKSENLNYSTIKIGCQVKKYYASLITIQ